MLRGWGSRVTHVGGSTRASRAGAQAIMHYPAGKRGSLFGEGGSRRSLGSCQSRRRERTSQPSRWTREVLGRCCTRWLWRMVLIKSIGVRTSRSQRFETEGAPHEVGAASTLLAQACRRSREDTPPRKQGAGARRTGKGVFGCRVFAVVVPSSLPTRKKPFHQFFLRPLVQMRRRSLVDKAHHQSG